ncbi:MAG: hypothetical protein ABI700_16210 [Chloroflexota bacterium]
MSVLIALALIVFGGFFGNRVSEDRDITPLPTIEAQATAEATPEATSCPLTSSRKDIEDALDFVGDIFEPPLWTLSAETGIDPMRTYVGWYSDALSARVWLEFVHYDCGVTQQDIDQFLALQKIPVVVGLYGSPQQINQCKGDNLQLFEFHVRAETGEDYHAFYWITQVSPTRVAAIAFFFPYSELLKEATYGLQLFPMLPACPPLGQ